MRYDLNEKAVMVAHCLGASYVTLNRALALLGINFMSQHTFERCEEHVGKEIKVIAEESMEEALEEEIELSKAKGDGTYHTEKAGTLPSLTMGTDTGWNKRSSGRRYDSASGVTNMVGGYGKKVCDSYLACNKCPKRSKCKSTRS